MKNKFIILMLALIGLSVFISNASAQVYSIHTVFDTVSYNPQKVSVFKTNNGKSWKEVCDSVPIASRMTYGTAYFKNKLWIFGGVSIDTSAAYDSVFSDIYSSSNGKKWKCVAKKTKVGPRSGSTMIVFKNELYSLGGRKFDSFSLYPGGKKIFGEVSDYSIYKTSNGKKWKKVSVGKDFEINPASFKAFVNRDTVFVVSNTIGDIFYTGVQEIWFTVDFKKWVQYGEYPTAKLNSGARFFNNQYYDIGGVAGLYNASNPNQQRSSNTIIFGRPDSLLVDTSSSLPKADRYGAYVVDSSLFVYVNNEVWKLVGSKWKRQSTCNPMNASPYDRENYRFIEVKTKHLNSSSSSSAIPLSFEDYLNTNEKSILHIKVYPNPATGFVSVCGLNDEAELVSINGKVLQKVKPVDGRAVFERGSLPAGFYIVRSGAQNSKIVFH